MSKMHTIGRKRTVSEVRSKKKRQELTKNGGRGVEKILMGIVGRERQEAYVLVMNHGDTIGTESRNRTRDLKKSDMHQDGRLSTFERSNDSWRNPTKEILR